MRSIHTIALGLVALVASAVHADQKAVEADTKLIDAVSPSLAVAEIKFRTDNGEQPYGAGWGARCPNCGQVHSSSVSSYVESERPLEVPAFFVADDRVIIPDPVMHSRFIDSIEVQARGHRSKAQITRHFVDQRAVELTLEKPIEGAKPLTFDSTTTDKDLKTIVYSEGNGRWATTVSNFSAGVTLSPTLGARINSVAKDSLIVTPEGKAVALVFSESLPINGEWKQSPSNWKSRSVEEQAAVMEKAKLVSDSGIVRVQLGLRSPRVDPNDHRRSFGPDNDDNATERHEHGIVVAPNRVIVLALLRPKVTARLERVTIYTSDGQSYPAKFVCSLKDYAALVVETEKPLPQVMLPSKYSLEAAVGPSLTLAEIRLAGETRTSYVSSARISGLQTGWRRHLYPEMTFDSDKTENAFVLDEEANLVALPLLRRPKPSGENEYRYSSNSPQLTFFHQLAPAIANPASAGDSTNIPLSEEEENRLAWLGVELQPLTPELARINNVAQSTQDGKTGALVTYVYAGSPAAKAGIEVGAVLLRLHVPDQPAPIDIQADAYSFAEQEFPWQQYDQFPEAYFDRMPHPWPTVATTLARTLTDIGFEKQVEIELQQSGKVQKKPLLISHSPEYFDTAAKVKHEPTGLTVKTMSFEVRRYFQIEPAAPGVIVAAIEPGSRASKGGLKPFEYVTHVNGRPVSTAEAFAKAAEGQAEVRLDVVRMNKSRVVKLNVEVAAAPATAPATAPAAPAQD